MGFMRTVFLWGSQNKQLRERLPRFAFVRRAMKRFMPGETVDDALRAAEELKAQGLPTILTQLGENLANENDARQVTEHYLDVLDKIEERKLDAYLSVKLTQLGFDLNERLCEDNLIALAERASKFRKPVWVDMEGSAYVQRTIDLFKRVRTHYPNVGLCLQAYLHRTPRDLHEMLTHNAALRIVKGAYKEPPPVALQAKKDVDELYFKLSRDILEGGPKDGLRPALGTHDLALLNRIKAELPRLNVSKDDFEIQMLYGIQSEAQLRLAKEGFRVRVLISYGSSWFPWYMRRLAERPANVWFVVKNMFVR